LYAHAEFYARVLEATQGTFGDLKAFMADMTAGILDRRLPEAEQTRYLEFVGIMGKGGVSNDGLAMLYAGMDDPKVRAALNRLKSLLQQSASDPLKRLLRDISEDYQGSLGSLGQRNIAIGRHLELYADVLTTYPKDGYAMLLGIEMGIWRGEIDRMLPEQERARILDCMRQLQCFTPALYTAFASGAPVQQALSDFRSGLLRDEVGKEEMDAFCQAYDMESLVAAVQLAIPAASPRYDDYGMERALLAAYTSFGDRRNDIPRPLRGKDFGGGEADRIHLARWRLGDGMVADEAGKLRAMLSALTRPVLGGEGTARAHEDEQACRSALRDYLAGDCQAEARKTALDAFFAYVRHGSATANVERIDHETHAGLAALEELFADRDALPVELGGVLRQLLRDEPWLIPYVSDGQNPIRNPKALGQQLAGLWCNTQVADQGKVERMSALLRGVSEDEIRTRLLPVLPQDAALHATVVEIGRRSTASRPATVDEIASGMLAEPLKDIRSEIGRFAFRETGAGVTLEFRVVKGIPFGVWSLNAGVCIGKDYALWQKPEFMLLAMFDKETGRAAGFIHLFEARIDGKKILAVPGMEPSIPFLSEVRARDVFPLMEKAVVNVAREGGYDAVLLPDDPNILSNRSDIRTLANEAYADRLVELDKKVEWNTVPHDYSFRTAYRIWSRDEE